MKRIILFNILLLIIAFGLQAENNEQLTKSIVLFGYGAEPPVSLDSSRGWTPIASIDWESNDMAPPAAGVSRRWRLHTSYEHSRSSSPATVQIRLRTAAQQTPTFTHPWSQGADIKADVYSNWYEDIDSISGWDGRGFVEARFITPPRTPVNGKLFSITLEAWDIHIESERATESSGPDVQLAYARPLPTLRVVNSPASRADYDAENPALSAEAALDFALSFVEACLTGDLPAYYRSQADPVRSLDDGRAMAKYRQTPPRGIPGITGLSDYKRRYDYRLYDSDAFGDLFPEWFDTSRPWIPNENSFLFMGHRDRLPGVYPEGVDYLVFLLEADADGNWLVAARPGN